MALRQDGSFDVVSKRTDFTGPRGLRDGLAETVPVKRVMAKGAMISYMSRELTVSRHR